MLTLAVALLVAVGPAAACELARKASSRAAATATKAIAARVERLMRWKVPSIWTFLRSPRARGSNKIKIAFDESAGGGETLREEHRGDRGGEVEAGDAGAHGNTKASVGALEAL